MEVRGQQGSLDTKNCKAQNGKLSLNFGLENIQDLDFETISK